MRTPFLIRRYSVSRRLLVGFVLVIACVAAVPLFVHGPAPIVLAPIKAGPAPTVFGWPAQLSLIAGDGFAGLQDGPIAQARFADPYGVAVEASGRIYVSDAGDSNRIRFIDPSGIIGTLAGSREGFTDGAGAAASFNTPSGIALDAAGNLIVADTGNHAIRKITRQGWVSTIAGTGSPGFSDGRAQQAQFNGPIGVAVDRKGIIYVADTYNDRIRAIGLDGTVSTLAGGEHPGDDDGPGVHARFDTPCALAVDPAGNVWVADTRNDAIRKITPSGEVSTFPATPNDQIDAALKRPLSIAVTHDGFLYVGEMAHGRVLQFSPAGEMVILTGPDASDTDVNGDRLLRPSALAIDASGALIASDAQSARVHRISARIARPAGTAAPTLAATSTTLLPTSAASTSLSGSVTSAVPVAAPAVSSPPSSEQVGPAPNASLPQTAGRWPLRPQNEWHEIAGTLGEVRGNNQGESRDHLHAGLDIHADVGAEVLAIADAKVSDPLSTWRFGDLSEGLAVDTLDYIHMRVGRTLQNVAIDPARFVLLLGEDGKPDRVLVRRGTRIHVGDVLGTVNNMVHVHLSLDGIDAQRNAIALGFVDLTDHVAPSIDSVQLVDAAGQLLTKKRKGRLLVPRDDGGIQIIVDAWDHVDNNLPRRRLGLYTLGYQVINRDGTPVSGFETPRMNIEFNRMPSDDHAVKIAYADKSGETVHGSAATHFRYVVTNIVRDGRAEVAHWSTTSLPPGDYSLRIIARDYAGNQAKRGSEIALTVE